MIRLPADPYRITLDAATRVIPRAVFLAVLGATGCTGNIVGGKTAGNVASGDPGTDDHWGDTSNSDTTSGDSAGDAYLSGDSDLPTGWTCSPEWYTDALCTCGCGALNPACGPSPTPDACARNGCSPGEHLDSVNLAICTPLSGTRYLSSIHGDDSADGRTRETAWLTLDHLSTLDFDQVDTVLFERGSVWHEVSLSFSGVGAVGTPVLFAAYGVGERPRLYGSRLMSGFVPQGDLWRVVDTDFPAFEPLVRTAPASLFINGTYYPDARHPNTGFFESTSYMGTTSLTDASQNWNEGQWVGGYVVIRAASWAWSLFRIGASSATTLTAVAGDAFTDRPSTNGRYFLIRNHPAACDQPGEWAQIDDTLSIVWPEDLTTATVELTVADTNLEFRDSFVVLRDLDIQRANLVNIMSIRTALSILDCEIAFAGSLWIWSRGQSGDSSHLDVRRSVLHHANHAGIYSMSNAGGTIEDNVFFDATVGRNVRNMRRLRSADIIDDPDESFQVGAAVHVQRNRDPFFIRRNRFENINIALQTHWSEAEWYFEENLVEKYGQTVGDIGAVYAGGDFADYCTSNCDSLDADHGKWIRNNIIVDAAMDGDETYGGPGAFAHAIYYDYRSQYIRSHANVIAHTNQAVYFHVNGNRGAFTDNLVYNAGGALWHPWNTTIMLDDLSNEYGEGYDITHCAILDNDIVFGQTTSTNELGAYWLIRPEKVSTIATSVVNRNDYYSPFSNHTEVFAHATDYTGSPAREQLGWNGFDTEGTINKNDWTWADVSGTIGADEFVTFLYNWSEHAESRCIPHHYVDLEGGSVSGEVVLAPYSGMVLFFQTAGAGCP